METPSLPSISMTLLSILIALTLTWAWRILNWVWLRPKRLERLLRQQGFNGNQYRFLFGDLKDMAQLSIESKSKPIGLHDDILPRVHPLIYQSVKTYGKDSFTWIGPTPRVNIMHPEHIKEIFAKIDHFQKPVLNPLVKLLATGLLYHNGAKWVTHKKIINPAFRQEKLKLMLPAFYSSCNRMVTSWEESMSTNESFELDVWPDLQKLTRDAISRTAFGSSYEEGKRIFELQTQQAELIIKSVHGVYIPGWRFLPTKMNRLMKNIDKQVQSLLRGIIDKKEKAILAGEASCDDLLGLMLESNMNENREHDGNKTAGMTIQDIIEECKVFYIAGQESTSNLLVWTMLLLSIHPEWQERARKEVLEVFGRDKQDIDGLNQLKIVTMILNEVLRLYPPALLTRSVHKDVKLGRLTIPAGVQLAIPTTFIQHDQEIWGEDSKEFKPERFAEGISKATKNHVCFFPFGWGPRICVGLNFSMINAKVAVATILQHFSFEISPSYAHTPTSIITLQPQYGVQLILRRYKN